ncbi:MAG TPA: hypothetical protein VF244_01630 [Acidimicrobiales bacterium]
MDLTPESHRKLDAFLTQPPTFDEAIEKWGTSARDQMQLHAALTDVPEG